MTEEEIYAQKMEMEANGGAGGFSDSAMAEQAEKKERAEYGRLWVWESYFNEKNKQQWLDTAEKLKHINVHVLQDIEDHILLKAFHNEKADKIKQHIDEDQARRIAMKKNQMAEEQATEYDKVSAEHTKKRRFMNSIRPPHYWNFFEDGKDEEKVAHVLRHNADPAMCYEDGRVTDILENINEIGHNLRGYEEVKWKTLFKHI